ncbi:hypothetical protein H632_c1250p0 [Helicosporidium sp. ATCC 50920]|nr:hypothetical protein H632_c1250p0 [Helicosporidium sp. ATCC 50920]|eukprot:KDD74529.1 hypothetical protein H632_c1250p0 [Helicosporidium sp. ATCC 50920]
MRLGFYVVGMLLSEKLKKAKVEADREIEAYKHEREAAQAQRMSADSSAAEETTARLRQDSDQVVANVKKSIASKKEEVLNMLLKHVTSVK